MDIEIVIANKKEYIPVVCGNVCWQTELSGTPGKLTFDVIKDSILDFSEGNQVRLKVDGKNIFYGYVFEKSRTKEGVISVTAYDRMRYLKNKCTYVYSGKTASTVIKNLSADYKIPCGNIAETKYMLPPTIEENQTLFDIMRNALDLTKEYTGAEYVLYDDFGKLSLKNTDDMKLDIIIDKDTAEDFNYSSSISSQTYNQIRLEFESKKSSERKIYQAQDNESIEKWGTLMYFQKLREDVNSKQKAMQLLKQYNKRTRCLDVEGAFGNFNVRAGTSLPVMLNLGDIIINEYMTVHRVSHILGDNMHKMNLRLIGGEFIA